jgi:hypothetical protein
MPTCILLSWCTLQINVHHEASLLWGSSSNTTLHIERYQPGEHLIGHTHHIAYREISTKELRTTISFIQQTSGNNPIMVDFCAYWISPTNPSRSKVNLAPIYTESFTLH